MFIDKCKVHEARQSKMVQPERSHPSLKCLLASISEEIIYEFKEVIKKCEK